MCLEDRPVLEPNAAGIDVGAREMFVAVPPGRDEYKYWMGHAGKDMSDLYDKIKEDVAFRRKWAERCGFGFQLPSVVPNVPKCTEKTEVAIAA